MIDCLLFMCIWWKLWCTKTNSRGCNIKYYHKRIDHIPLHRKNKKCSICRIRNNINNVCIKCEYPKCDEYPHPICSRKKKTGKLIIDNNDILNTNNNTWMVQDTVKTYFDFKATPKNAHIGRFFQIQFISKTQSK